MQRKAKTRILSILSNPNPNPKCIKDKKKFGHEIKDEEEEDAEEEEEEDAEEEEEEEGEDEEGEEGKPKQT
jgi:hypothetical protein